MQWQTKVNENVCVNDTVVVKVLCEHVLTFLYTSFLIG